MKKIIVGLALFGVLAVGLTGCDVAQGYVDKGKQVISADNLEEQTDRVTKDWTALQTTADNACAASDPKTQDPNSPTFVEGPGLAYAATYRRVWADYNARQNNIFKAGFIGPAHYPKLIPNYVTGVHPDFCDVSTKLVELKASF